MALSDNRKKLKPTRVLYKRIYRMYIAGMNHAGLRSHFKKSQSTIERALDWCKKNGINALPTDDALLEATLNDINYRRVRLITKTKSSTIDELVKLNKAIIDLDNQRLTIKGLLIDKKQIECKIKKDDVLDKILDALTPEQKKEMEES